MSVCVSVCLFIASLSTVLGGREGRRREAQKVGWGVPVVAGVAGVAYVL